MGRLLVLTFLVLAVAIGLAAGYWTLDRLFGDVDVVGVVVDSEDGRPVREARLSVGTPDGPAANTTVGADGAFQLRGVKRQSTLSVEAPGYHRISVVVERPERLEVSLTPRSVSGTVRDAYTGAPVARALLSAGPISTTTDATGTYRLLRLGEGTGIAATAAGYVKAESPPPAQPTVDFTLRPDTLRGRVIESRTGQAIAGATVQIGDAKVAADAAGLYRLEGVPALFTISVSALGYQRRQVTVERQTVLDVALEPSAVRAPYVTFFAIGNPAIRRDILSLIETTELNGIVIDIKGDRGLIAYQSQVPLAREIGALSYITIPDVDELLATFKKKGIYSIARIVVFKDDPLGRARPDWAVKDRRTGRPWVDGEGLVWVDPFRKEVWDYNIALAKEAIRRGFDEVQFDYIRFPTDPSAGTTVGNAVYSRPNTQQSRLEAISGFLAQARVELRPLGGYTSIDVFGLVCWEDNDMGIGQHLETIAPHVDYISPMVYPSTFHDGLPTDPPSYRTAAAYPYEIVHLSLKKAMERLKNTGAKIRPWLQYFDDYPWATGRVYAERDIQAQKKAAADAGAIGWMLWDPFVLYDKGGIEKR